MPTKIGNISGGGIDLITYTINITNNTNYGLYAAYGNNSELILINYLNDAYGSAQPYCFDGKMWGVDSNYNSSNVIAASGGQGSVQVIGTIGYSGTVEGIYIDTSKLINSSAAENVTITSNGYQTIFTLTDPTTSGSFNIEIAEYWPD